MTHFPVADRDSERHLKKFFKKLIGRKGIEDALSKLDRLTQEEVNMATVQILKLAHHIKGGVGAVSEEVKDVGDNVNRAYRGYVQHVSYSQIPSQTTND
jgi:hypothetical protein